ncbi:MAG: MGMT family protein [Patescibacteria group bacterium]
MQKNSNFFEEVYKLVRKIPRGKVSTYGEIAKALGTRDARRIGHALHANPNGDITPCHRVVNKDGRVAQGYVFGGANVQKNKLLVEGVEFINNNCVNLTKSMYYFINS